MREDLFELGAIFGIVIQHLPHQSIDLLRYNDLQRRGGGVDLEFLAFDLAEYLLFGIPGKWVTTVEHLIKYNSQGVDIPFMRGMLAEQDFRSLSLQWQLRRIESRCQLDDRVVAEHNILSTYPMRNHHLLMQFVGSQQQKLQYD